MTKGYHQTRLSFDPKRDVVWRSLWRFHFSKIILPTHCVDFARVLKILRNKLAGNGTLNILQPNYRYAYREYFDDYTHVSVFSHISIVDFLNANGFDVIEIWPRFLPLTVKSRLPVSPGLIKAYLASPIKPLAKQMLVRATVSQRQRQRTGAICAR